MADTLHSPDTPRRSIGVIGLGLMGGAMASNLVTGGWRVIGYDIDAKAMTAARQKGIEVVDDAAAVAAAASDIITSLPSPQAAHRNGRDDRRRGTRSPRRCRNEHAGARR